MLRAISFAVVGLLMAISSLAAEEIVRTEPVLHRIFLNQPAGASLVSYGTYARVLDKVVFSLPIGPTGPSAMGQLVSIPATSVDWRATVGYADAVRRRRSGNGWGNGERRTEMQDPWAGPNRISTLPPPGLQESIRQALAVARLTDVPAERMSVLEQVIGVLDRSEDLLPHDWTAAIRTSAVRELAVEHETTRAYASLETMAVTRAAQLAALADVRGVRAVIDDVIAHDSRLGNRRPREVAAIVAAVDQRLEAAQVLRLAHDHWNVRGEAYQKYDKQVAPVVERFARDRETLDEIRWLAGPDPSVLGGLIERLGRLAESLDGIVPPDELASIHMLYEQSIDLARRSAVGRQHAVTTGDLDIARQAGAAAAGAVLLFDRASDELERSLTPPKLH